MSIKFTKNNIKIKFSQQKGGAEVNCIYIRKTKNF